MPNVRLSYPHSAPVVRDQSEKTRQKSLVGELASERKNASETTPGALRRKTAHKQEHVNADTVRTGHLTVRAFGGKRGNFSGPSTRVWEQGFESATIRAAIAASLTTSIIASAFMRQRKRKVAAWRRFRKPPSKFLRPADLMVEVVGLESATIGSSFRSTHLPSKAQEVWHLTRAARPKDLRVLAAVSSPLFKRGSASCNTSCQILVGPFVALNEKFGCFLPFFAKSPPDHRRNQSRAAVR